MAEDGDHGGGGGDDPRMEMLQQYCLKTMKMVSSNALHSYPGLSHIVDTLYCGLISRAYPDTPYKKQLKATETMY